jgi:hypothetical protein
MGQRARRSERVRLQDTFAAVSKTYLLSGSALVLLPRRCGVFGKSIFVSQVSGVSLRRESNARLYDYAVTQSKHATAGEILYNPSTFMSITIGQQLGL